MTKPAKSEILFFILSLGLVALCTVIYLFHSQKEPEHKPSRPKSTAVAKPDTALKDFTERLTSLEQDPQAEQVQQLKADYQSLKSSPEKDALEVRLTALDEELTRITTAEETVALAEQFGYQSYIQEAQALVEALTTTAAKARLQERLNRLTTPTEASPAVVQTPVETPASASTED